MQLPEPANVDTTTSTSSSPDSLKTTPAHKLTILAGSLFDPYTGNLVGFQEITVNPESGLIEDVQPISHEEYDINVAKDVIDLRHATVLPGLVDVHVHFFLHPYSETPWTDQVTKENVVERTVRATVHAKNTLLAGYTTVRDLGTEGAGDADLHLRKCLSGPDALIPGPRYFCANRAIACTGSYGPKGSLNLSQNGVEGITGAEFADGVDGCIKAVRRQIGAGADWIKIYANYRFRSRLGNVATAAMNESTETFSPEELKAMIDTAHRYGVKVAAHATNRSTIALLESYGVDSIEHGVNRGDELAVPGTQSIWVPTLAVYDTEAPGSDTWNTLARTFQKLVVEGPALRVACGGDTGTFAHGENAREMKLMVRLGAGWRDVLRWATLGGWECVRSMRWEGLAGKARLEKIHELREDRRVVGDNEVPFGAIRKGFAADIIATTGDFDADFDAAVSADSISFVMKAGRVYKSDGKSLV
ncbi:hypothetical protein PLICRDRAFT_35213 [Plicaturopsis crispa FD-325 SS-3]|nr:hypothetical protein PLICRDRAFT_35213 [Plicaturopsis crispa FD-325 SS-3]